ncbi:hypothetical protein PHLCEN_2v9385 [Hermanssonia centrifuga]|uniref:Uncharacterized protein n=1 Tax=Hermanssonia centrifuga TaxID=98765 RepID=A0A2R6NQZ3_9APHY|nr:hypothetical protein PHLCEN_2v9385 [Hermanssonia centrifuga]
MSILPQAYVLILRQLTPLIYPTILVIASFSFLRRLLNVVVPTWIVVIAVLISMPSFMITRAQIFHWLNARRAARLGAVLPPRWNGKRIGNLDVLEVLRKINVDGYLSDNFWEKMHELGPTYEVSIMWDPDYVTSDVNIIKNVLATDFNNWVKGEKFDAFMKSVLGTGVFNSDGDMWK